MTTPTRSSATSRSKGWKLEWIIETHVHADHLSAAPYIQQKLGGKLGIGENITIVQDTFGKVFNEGTEFQRDGSQFDRLFKDGDLHDRHHDRLCHAHARPHAGLHDACGRRCGLCRRHAVHARWRHGTRRLPRRRCPRALPLDEAHPGAAERDAALHVPRLRAERARHPVGDHGRRRARAQHPCQGRHSEDEFVAMREARDATLAMPRLIIPSLQVNMRAGQLPPKDEDGKTFLKVPVNTL
jgi:hypothetical protein